MASPSDVMQNDSDEDDLLEAQPFLAAIAEIISRLLDQLDETTRSGHNEITAEEPFFMEET